MCSAVRAEFVTAIHDFLCVFGVFLHPKFHGEKGAFDVVLSHNFQQFVGVIHPPSAIETDGDFFLFRCHAVNGQHPFYRDGGGGVLTF